MPAVLVSVSVQPDLLERFDRARGTEPRSTLLQELMERFLEEEGEDGA